MTVRWVDTSGDDRWTASQPWFRNVDLVIFVFSPQVRTSWLGIPRWIERANEWHRGPHERLLLGIHRTGRRIAVPHDAVIAVAMLWGVTYVEHDAVHPCGVTSAVRALCSGSATSVQGRFVLGGGDRERPSTPEGSCFNCQCSV